MSNLSRKADSPTPGSKTSGPLHVGLSILVLTLITGCGNPQDEEAPDAYPDFEAAPITSRLAPPGDDYDRLAAQQEAFYALDPAHTGKSTKSINGMAVSDWRYLYSDLNAYSVAKSWYGSDSSLISSFYSDPYSYSLTSQGYGRSGQCRYFAAMLLYRAGIRTKKLPTYQATINDYYGPRVFTESYSHAHVGDVISTNWVNGHTAVVVKILAGVEGQSVTSVDVVDSNYLATETVGRHPIAVSGTGSGVGDLRNYIVMNTLLMKWNGK